MKKHLIVALVSAATLALAFSTAQAQNLAVVNGVPVPSSRLDAFVQQMVSQGRQVDDAAKTQMKEEIITREVFVQEGQKRGLDATEEFKNQMEMARQGILIRALIAEQQKVNPISDADIKAEYDRFVAENGGKEYRAHHILVEKEADAKAIIAQLKKGAKFEAVAKKSSKDGSAANGGDLDWANPKAYVKEFSDALASLKKGKITDVPVKSQYGYHIIRLDDVRDIKLPTLDEIKSQIVQHLQQTKLEDYRKELMAKAKIE